MGSSFSATGLTGFFCLAMIPTAVAAGCTETGVDLRGPAGTAHFTVEVADTASERSLGLMNRNSMASSAGMLFVYERPQTARFWMKDTLIPLDMVFADATGTVTRVHSNAVPMDETPIEGGSGVAVVLEINGGLAKRLGIDVGTELRHPAINQSLAVWPCEAE